MFWHQKKLFFCTLSSPFAITHTHSTTNTRSVWREKKFFNTSNIFFLDSLVLRYLLLYSCCFLSSFFSIRHFSLFVTLRNRTKHKTLPQLGNSLFRYERKYSVWIIFFLWLLIFQFFSYTLSTHASNTVCILTYMCIYQMHRIVVVAVVVVVFFDWYKFRSKKAHTSGAMKKRKFIFALFFDCSSSQIHGWKWYSHNWCKRTKELFNKHS